MRILVLLLFLPNFAIALDSKLIDRLGLEQIHDDVPKFEFKNANGDMFNSESFRSKALILHFWATWCESCKKELPQLKTLSDSMPKMEFIPLSSDDKAEDVQKFIVGVKVQLATYVLTPIKENKKFIAWGIPMTYFISRKRDIFLRARGAKDWTHLSPDDLKKLSQVLE